MGLIQGNLPSHQSKAQFSLPSPFSSRNCIEHAVHEWEVQWITSPEADLDGATPIIALLALEAADASEIGARLRVLFGKQAEVVRGLDGAYSRGNLRGGALRVSRSRVGIQEGRDTSEVGVPS